ncbi:MAG: dioxygenase [Alphaproteobacteria bacterium]|nr:dioxygenase [Alphaproteobacteria bacterium SS10]
MAMPNSLFVSHGAPNLLESDVPARSFLKRLGNDLPKPRAILAVSAHYETAVPTIGLAAAPETIHDFFGFSPSLHAFNYPAKGMPALATQIADDLAAEGIEVARDEGRGLDHGIWVPLALAYPDADIPVIPFSIQPDADAAHHLAIGQALAKVVPSDVLVVATGSMTHNLSAFRGHEIDAPPPDWVSSFADWIEVESKAGDLDRLVSFAQQAPNAGENHPTDEHFLPFFVALGVAAGRGDWRGTPLHRSYTFGVLAMDTYRFDGVERVAA